MFVIINCLLLMAGAISAVFGISFFWRNKGTSDNLRIYILLYGISSAGWCIGYGFIGILDDFAVCAVIRRFAILCFDLFMINETFMGTEAAGLKKRPSIIVRILTLALSVADYIIFGIRDVNVFFRQGPWTTWYADPVYAFNRNFHSVYLVIMFSVLITIWYIWLKRAEIKRIKSFLYMFFIANLSLIAFGLPDTFLPMVGLPAVPASGFGGAVCTIAIWVGATRLNSFNIRMGNIMTRLFEFLEVGIIALTPDKKIGMVNRYAANLMDRDGESCQDISDFFDMTDEIKDQMFEISLDDIYTERLWDKSGSHAYSVRMNAMKDYFGEPFCYLCVFLDVTDEVETAKKLEMASNAKSRFLAQMSHEIRTPINAVLGMNEMILRESSDPEILEYAENIDSAGNTLLTLINSILDFSKIEDGKMDIIPVKYDTASLIHDLYNSIAQRAEAKGLELELDVDTSLPGSLYGDDVRLSQIIMNLLTNAVKYTESGKVTLCVREKQRKDDSIELFVSVKDTGMGIKEEDMDKLSVSFERLEEKKNRNIEGTGLGISIVTNLLDMMGSRLCVESTYGEGSCFYFTIEQGIVDRQPIGDLKQAFEKKHASRASDELISASGARVLVVDDNAMNLKVARNLLKLCHIKPDMAVSGFEAIELMKKQTYDIVFLDHMMPKMDGIETLHELQSKELIPQETVMIALTADAVIGAREKYLDSGFDDYLSKPIDLMEMTDELKKYLPESAYDEEYGKPKASSYKEYEVLEFSPEGDEEVVEFSPEKNMEVMEFGPEGDDDAVSGGAYDIGGLRSCGMDTDAGVRYCAGDEGMYFEMLDDFVAAFEEKHRALCDFYEKKDWREYSVMIHALKSNAKTLGINDLAQKALILENASKEENEAAVVSDHDMTMNEYRSIVEAIRKEKR
ncbi:MAG: response regulator [Lachnospiraceae bacterium]|nr:response regulator [Lachnospiraceae bacterium]